MDKFKNLAPGLFRGGLLAGAVEGEEGCGDDFGHRVIVSEVVGLDWFRVCYISKGIFFSTKAIPEVVVTT